MDFHQLTEELRGTRRTWLITGVAGFIGSHLLEALLQAGQTVIGLDDFSTGSQRNLEEVRTGVGSGTWERFTLIEADVADAAACHRACQGADVVLHEAALASVPVSIQDPASTHRSNVEGFLNLLIACRDQGVGRVVYASSSAIYGNDPTQPKHEGLPQAPLSPYALSKSVDEQYAALFERLYSLPAIGLRYFNVFGRRQDPRGPYAAVIPIWISNLLHGKACVIHGDGHNTRDFCHIQNIVFANLLSALRPLETIQGRVFNVASGQSVSLKDLEGLLRRQVTPWNPGAAGLEPLFGPPREGDVVHSRADLSAVSAGLGYAPVLDLVPGLEEAMPWYFEHL